MITDDQSATIAFLSDPGSYDGAVHPVERIETHTSIVFLVGGQAYKMKRAVRFSYLDYSTVERRQQACEMECRLNGRTAPELYIGVQEIRRGRDGFLSFGGEGKLVDNVVVMRRFDQASLLDSIARHGGLNRELMQELADRIAAFHRSAEVDREYGGKAQLLEVIDGNTRNLAMFSPLAFDASAVARLAAESLAALQRWGALIEERRLAGKVRLCHGDLHLRNICLVDGRPTLFDCIEFSRSLACVDVLYDLSFLLMDLVYRGFLNWANFGFNRYFDRETEVDGAVLLPLFMSMHAAIRAHVTMAAPQARPGGEAFDQSRRDGRRYLDEALSLLVTQKPQILAIGGFSGTGKSTLAYAIAPELGNLPGARVLRSDVIRKRMMGVPPEMRLPPSAYTDAASRAVYAILLEEARRLVVNGHSVILDATFAAREERDAAVALTMNGTIPFRGIWLDAPAKVLEARVQARSHDASDATIGVIRQQVRDIEKPADWPVLDTTGPSALVLTGAREILSSHSVPPDHR